MSFLYSAFIENIPEAREWLESIGYKKYTYSGSTDNGEYICTHNHSYSLSEYKGIFTEVSKRDLEASIYLSSIYKKHVDKTVDCRGNFSLFKSVTALRDDSDYMQWYIENKWIETGIGGQMVGSELRRKIGEQWYLYLNNDSKMTERIKMDIECSHNGKSDFRKATLEELIEHFKTKTI